MRRLLIGLTLGILIGVGGVAFYMSPLGPPFEHTAGLSWLFKLRGPIAPPPEVVVVAIDGRTGQQLDLPDLPREWPRSIHGELVDALVRGGASVIAFDVHFGRLREDVSDQAFVDAVRRAGNVVMVELLTGKRQPIADQAGRHVGVVWLEEAVPPFPELAEAAAAIASFPLPKKGASVHQFWVFKDSTDQGRDPAGHGAAAPRARRGHRPGRVAALDGARSRVAAAVGGRVVVERRGRAGLHARGPAQRGQGRSAATAAASE
jgi:adenylate cyclase